MKMLKARLPEETKKAFQEIASKQGETEASLCRRVIVNYIKEERKNVKVIIQR